MALSCNGENGFGYLIIEKDHVVSYTGDPNRPEIHKFCNDEIIQAVKLKEIVEERAEGERIAYNNEEFSQDRKKEALLLGTTLQGMLEASKT